MPDPIQLTKKQLTHKEYASKFSVDAFELRRNGEAELAEICRIKAQEHFAWADKHKD